MSEVAAKNCQNRKYHFFLPPDDARELAQLADQLPTELCIRVRIEFGLTLTLKARTLAIAYLTALRFPPSKVCFSRHLLVLVNRTHQAG